MNLKHALRFISIFAALTIGAVSLSLPVTAAASVLAPTVTMSVENTDAAAPIPPDVTPDMWFYGDVTRLLDEGIVNAYPDGSFYPSREISNAEFVKILIMTVGYDLEMPIADVIFPESWASDYLSLAYTLGIIGDEDLEAGFSPDAPITRASMTEMMMIALGIDPAPIDDPFADTSDEYARAAYNAYLLRGVPSEDGKRLYNGTSRTSRAEAAAIAVRMLEYMRDPYEFFKNAVLENAAVDSLDTESEIVDLFYVLNRELMSEFTLITNLPLETWTPYFRLSNTLHLEYFYSSRLDCKYRPGSTEYKLTLIYDEDIEVLKRLHGESEAAADAVIIEIIDENMTPEERVKAIHDYIVLSCEYDYANYQNNTIPLESRIAYGPLNAQTAVCQGYVAAFNMLCRRAGIRSTVIAGTAPSSPDSHAWNMILLNGELFFVDTTHDDPVPDKKGEVSHKYYLLTEAEMMSLGYLWDKSQSQIKYLY